MIFQWPSRINMLMAAFWKHLRLQTWRKSTSPSSSPFSFWGFGVVDVVTISQFGVVQLYHKGCLYILRLYLSLLLANMELRGKITNIPMTITRIKMIMAVFWKHLHMFLKQPLCLGPLLGTWVSVVDWGDKLLSPLTCSYRLSTEEDLWICAWKIICIWTKTVPEKNFG